MPPLPVSHPLRPSVLFRNVAHAAAAAASGVVSVFEELFGLVVPSMLPTNRNLFFFFSTVLNFYYFFVLIL